MTSMDLEWAPWTILLPIFGATLAVSAGTRGAAAARIALATLLATLAAGVLALERLSRTGAERHEIGGWDAPLGIVLTLDGWGLGFVVLGTGVATLVGCYSSRAWPEQTAIRARFSSLLLLLVAGLNALFLSGDLFNLYVTLEVVGISAAGLAAIERNRRALRAALQYLLLSLAGSFCYLAGVVLVYREHGVLDLALLAERSATEPLSALAAALMTAGLMLKAALFPLHAWLPPAHASAAASVSAMLSGLVVKGAFFALLRVSLATWPELHGGAVAWMLGTLGACGIFWGYGNALRSDRLKVIMAYSTVAQMGQLFLVFPLAAAGAGVAIPGVLMLAASHALGKSAAFLCAGNVQRVSGGDRLEDFAACAGRLPLTQGTLALASLSLVGIPPSAGFVAKWLLLEAAIVTQQWLWCGVLVIGTILAAAVMLRILQCALVDPEPASDEERAPVSEWPPFLLAVAATALGLLAGPALVLAQQVEGPAAQLMGAQ